MTIFSNSLFSSLRQRLGLALGILAFSAFCGLMGVFLAFFQAPGQALQARRIARMPVLGPDDVASASAGEMILITGVLKGNPPVLENTDLVAYTAAEWVVTLPERDEGESDPRGEWEKTATLVPDLTLAVNEQLVRILADDSVKMDGSLREVLIPGEGPARAEYEERPLPDGSLRYRGVSNGDRVTVLGTRASTEGVIPEEMFAGDRVAFEEDQRQEASGLFFAGMCLIGLAPLILVLGFLGVIFKRR
jgi:hypothetical protein